MLSKRRDMRRIKSQTTANNFVFKVANEFVYFSTAVTRKYDDSLEFKRRVTLTKMCYYGLSRQLCSRDLWYDKIVLLCSSKAEKKRKFDVRFMVQYVLAMISEYERTMNCTIFALTFNAASVK